MAKCYLTGKTTVTGNKRSHALNATKTKQNTNLQIHRNESGKKERLSVKEIRNEKKKEKAA